MAFYNPYSYMNTNVTPYQGYQSPSTVTATPTQPTQGNNGLIWVQGENGAKSYMVAPNTTVMLMDSEAKKFYLKSADASGFPMPIRVFEYEEISAPAKVEEAGPGVAFVTQDEFAAFKEQVTEMVNAKSKKKEVAKDE